MIRSYNDHAANERTFLAWVRTGLSIVALGIVVKKGSLFAVVMAGASSPGLSGSGPDYFSDYGGLVLIGTGMATIAGAAVRLLNTALRIDDHSVHSAGIIRVASALLRHRRQNSRAVERISTNANSSPARKWNGRLDKVKRSNLELMEGTDRRIARWSPSVVSLWRHRFADQGPEGLKDRKPSGKVDCGEHTHLHGSIGQETEVCRDQRFGERR